MKRRLSQDAWVLIILLIFMIIIGGFAGRRQDGSGSGMDVIPRRTTYSDKYGGLKGLHDTLHKLGYPVARQLKPLSKIPKDGVLFIVSPESSISNSEWKMVQSWVERGNTLVVASDQIPPIAPDESKLMNSTPSCPSFLAPDVKNFQVSGTERADDKEWSFGGDSSLPGPFG